MAVARSRPTPTSRSDWQPACARSHGLPRLLDLYSRFSLGEDEFDNMMRRVIWRAACRSLGHGVQIGAGVGFKHVETFEVGAGVFVGAQAYIQGRFDGVCRIRQSRLDRPTELLRRS
jgi:hypothetical protein